MNVRCIIESIRPAPSSLSNKRNPNAREGIPASVDDPACDNGTDIIVGFMGNERRCLPP
jgi:hypothetical protein